MIFRLKTAISALFLSLSLSSAILAANRPLFVIFEKDANFVEESRLLELQGVRIRQRVPPQIIVGEMTKNVSLSNSRVESQYTSAIPLSRLEPLGPLAMAAGIQWNRQLVSTAKTQGGFSSMRALVAKNSLPVPTGLSVVAEGPTVRVSYQALNGAAYYEVEMGPVRTRTNRTTVVLPTDSLNSISVRVRGVDHLGITHSATEDVLGDWSNLVTAAVHTQGNPIQVSAPVLTSPVNQYESEGFTVILEWDSPTTSQSRVQISRDASFSDILIDEVHEGNEYVIPGSLLHIGDQLYWRVQRWGLEDSPWSSSRELKIGEPHHHVSDMFINPESSK